MYAKMGGMERMRGYYEGRYRDKKLVETQIELRGRKSTAATASWDGSAAGRSGARRNSAGETRFAVSAAATASNSRTA